ncbi:MAG: adenylate/guanylate cyclase domain-containing protein [Bacteroidota bacterium]
MKNIIFLLFVFLTSFPREVLAQQASNSLIDSLYAELRVLKEDTNKVKQWNKLCLASKQAKQTVDGVKYGMSGLQLAEKLNWKPGMALCYSSIGRNYLQADDCVKAFEYFLRADSLYIELEDGIMRAATLLNLGRVYLRQWNYPMAMECDQQALEVSERIGDKRGIALATYLMANVAHSFKDYTKAKVSFKKAEMLFRELRDTAWLFNTIEALCDIYNLLGNHKETIKHCLKTIHEEEQYAGIKNPPLDGLVTARRVMAESYRKKGMLAEAIAFNLAAKSVAITNQVALWEIHFIELGIGLTLLDAYQTKETICIKGWIPQDTAVRPFLNCGFISNSYEQRLDSAIANLSRSMQAGENENDVVQDCALGLAKAYKLKGDFKKAHYYQEIYIGIRDSVFGEDRHQKMAALEVGRLDDIHQKEKQITALELKNANTQKYSLYIGLLLLVVTLGILYNRYLLKHKANTIITDEKARSEALLLNILPSEIAEELKKNGSAKAKDFESVTVLFTDFKNFTQLSEQLSAEQLVEEIHYCYSSFDSIVAKHNVEKIKTIGDSYMCVGGLPAVNNTHAADVVHAAIEMRDFIETEKHKRIAENKPYFEIRIGCNTGPVVAGIVGTRKFAYDIWGDTVNIASRMESSGETGKVNISGSTYELVKNLFTCTHRGKMEAKNKGQIDMYFVEM